MRRLTLTLDPDCEFEVPYSTGYQSYSGLLSLIDEVDDDVADEIHNSPFGSLTNSGLLGRFVRGGNRNYHHLVSPENEYTVKLGITDSDDGDLFETLISQFVISDNKLPLAHGNLSVKSVESENISIDELMREVKSISETASGVRFNFESTTCLNEYGDVWETYPNRSLVFNNILRKWNAVVGETHELSISDDVIGTGLYECPEADDFDTMSEVVYRTEAATDGGDDGEVDVIHKMSQGFVGTWEYRFKNISEASRNAILILSRFAEFSGVGENTSRGCGTVSTEVIS